MANPFPEPYSPSTQVKDFHQMPHYDFSFHSVSSAFAPEDRAYQESLVQLALPLSIVAALFFLYFVFRACCCGGRESTPFKPNEARVSRIALVVVLLLACAGIALTYVGSVHASSAVGSFTDSTTATQGKIDTLSNQASGVAADGLSLSNTLANITVPPGLEGNRTAAVAALRGAASSMASVVSRVQATVKVAQWNDDVHAGDRARAIASLVFSSLLAALVLLAAVGLLCKSFGVLRVAYGFLVPALLVCWVACAAELALSVGTADFCMDPNGYVSTKIADDVASYYIQCRPTDPDPLQSYFAVAQDSLRTAAAAARALGNATSYDVPALVAGLSGEVDELQSALNCTAGLHDTFAGCVDAVCGDGMRAMVMLCFSHGTTGLLLLIAMLLIQRVVAAFHTRFNYVVNTALVDTTPSERTRLLDKGFVL